MPKLFKDDNPTWKGKNAGKDAFHKYLERYYPKIGICQLCNKKTKTNYIFKHSHKLNYTRNINDYMEACQSCHEKYDYKIGVRIPYNRTKELNEKMSKITKGIHKSKEHKEKLSKSMTKFHFTRNELIGLYWISEKFMNKRIINKNQKSAFEIASLKNTNESTIRNNIKKFNIPIRTRSEAKKLFDMK